MLWNAANPFKDVDFDNGPRSLRVCNPPSPPSPPSVRLDLASATTHQSSTNGDGASHRAVASSPSSSYGGGTCTHTGGESNPWWEVVLPHVTTTSLIRVLNRNQYGSRLNGFTVAVGGVTCASNVQIAEGAWADVACSATGSVVRISLPRNGYLTLCGVEVYGFAPAPSLALAAGTQSD